MPVINVKKDGQWQDIASTYKHTHTSSDITDLPADTADVLASLQEKVGADSVAYQINTAVQASQYVHPDTHSVEMITGLSDVAISGDYNDLKNIPEILDGYTHPDTHPADMITGLSTVATSGSYNDLNNKPVIPYAFTFRERKGIFRIFSKNPFVDLHVGEPILPDTTLPQNEAVEKMHKEAYRVMQELAGILPGDPLYNENQNIEEYEKVI